MDTRATHNFIAEEEAKRIGLKWEKDSSQVKAANSVALPLFGVAKDVELLIGEWRERASFSVAPPDDFFCISNASVPFLHF